MRRSVGLALIALGVLALLLGPLLRIYAYPRVAVVPDESAGQDPTQAACVDLREEALRETMSTCSVSAGSGVEILDIELVAAGATDPVRAMDVTSVRSVVPDVQPRDDIEEVAVWDTGVVTTADDVVRSAYQERVAFDRGTGESVPDPNGAMYGQYYGDTAEDENGDPVEPEPVEHTGWYFKLPFGTEKTDYEFWDSTLQRSTPLLFDGEDTIEGLAVYRFVQQIEAVDIADQDLPGGYFGSDEPTVTADRFYANTRTLWVEPNTGVIIRGQEEQDAYFEFEGERLTVTKGTVAYTDETVAANIDTYESKASLLNLIRNVLPIVLPIAGLVLIVMGVLLVRDRQRPRRARSGETPPPDGDTDGSLLDHFGESRDEVAAGGRAARRRSG